MSEPELTREQQIVQALRWAEAGKYTLSNVERDGKVVMSADVTWPDGGSGRFVTNEVSEQWQMIDAYTMTHVGLGLEFYQGPPGERDAEGFALEEPLMVVREV